MALAQVGMLRPHRGARGRLLLIVACAGTYF
jgi:hypothetical protein